MDFSLLGPLEVRQAGIVLPLGSTKQQVLLAYLLLHSNRQVSVAELAEVLWDGSSPRTAVKNIQLYVSRLRRILCGSPPVGRLVTVGRGYRLAVGPDELDLERCRRLVDEGIRARAAADADRAISLFSQALGLWQGRPLASLVETRAMHAEVERLEELRLTLYEEYFDAQLSAGQHAAIVPELQHFVGMNPLRERVRGQLMLALYRSGRRASALAAYREGYRLSVSEQGVEPGRQLQELHSAVLADAVPAVPGRPDNPPVQVRPAPPCELPTPPKLVGRARQRRIVRDGLLDDTEDAPVVCVDGLAGIGKSALAVYVAHQIADAFPGGIFYVDLLGSTADRAPLDPRQPLLRMLRTLGVDDTELPAEIGEAAALLRAATANRRVLLVLDNAVDAQQVRWLLPGRGSAALVTSRQCLAPLSPSTRVSLREISDEEAVTLLVSIVGDGRVGRDTDAAHTLVQLCAHHPLALKVAGMRLAARPQWPVQAMVDVLRPEAHRLAELRAGDLDVRTCLAASLRQLDGHHDPDRRRADLLLRDLGRLGLTDIHAAAAAAWHGQPAASVSRWLEILVDANLLESRGQNRYRMSDLIRLYVGAEPDPAAQVHAVHRLLVCYLRAVTRLRRMTLWLRPRGEGVYRVPDALLADWLSVERSNTVTVSRRALAAWPAAVRLVRPLTRRLHWLWRLQDDWDLSDPILPAARRAWVRHRTILIDATAVRSVRPSVPPPACPSTRRYRRHAFRVRRRIRQVWHLARAEAAGLPLAGCRRT